MSSPNPESPAIAKAVLKPRRALPFFSKHPWVFAGAVARIEGEPDVGDEIELRTHKNEFVARGLYNPNSNILVRLYSWDESTHLDESFWKQKIQQAIALRKRLYPEFDSTSAGRMIYSEGDGLSGLIVDRYGDWLTLQMTSLAMSKRLDLFVEILQQELKPAGIWLRTEKGIREREQLELVDGLVCGEEPPRPLFIEENGVRFGIDIVEGQKTGFYLDQRENRAAVAKLTNGHQVLDLFCNGGGFGLTALKQGNAKQVLGVDVSESALTLARGNAELNNLSSQIEFQKSRVDKALEQLAEEGRTFDTIILDPPKMTRHRSGISQAIKGYLRLNKLAVERLNPDGILATCSCSGLVSDSQFEDMLAQVGLETGRIIQILEKRSQAADHPSSVHCPESRYLKCYILRVVSP